MYLITNGNIVQISGISFTDISNGGPYSGTQTDTLVVEVIPTVNYYQFRCVVSNISGSDSTTNAFPYH